MICGDIEDSTIGVAANGEVGCAGAGNYYVISDEQFTIGEWNDGRHGQ